MIWDILEEETGARLTHSFGRIGGMAQPAHRRASRRRAAPSCRRSLKIVDEGEALLLEQPHLPRSPARASASSRQERRHLARRGPGPCLRATGVAVRRAQGAPVPRATTRSTSTCRSATTATTTIASWCASEEMRQSVPHHRAGARAHARRRPGQRRRPARHPAAEGRGLHDDRRHHPALQARDGGRRRCPPARSTRTPRAATASSASTSCPTAAARRTACASARRASSTCRASSS